MPGTKMKAHKMKWHERKAGAPPSPTLQFQAGPGSHQIFKCHSPPLHSLFPLLSTFIHLASFRHLSYLSSICGKSTLGIITSVMDLAQLWGKWVIQKMYHVVWPEFPTHRTSALKILKNKKQIWKAKRQPSYRQTFSFDNFLSLELVIQLFSITNDLHMCGFKWNKSPLLIMNT